jgi:hypothetical protein
MAHIETLKQDGKNIFVGVVEFDDCQEIIDSFDGEIQEGRFIIPNTDDILPRLYQANLIEKGERDSLENCDFIAFTGVKA